MKVFFSDIYLLVVFNFKCLIFLLYLSKKNRLDIDFELDILNIN